MARGECKGWHSGGSVTRRDVGMAWWQKHQVRWRLPLAQSCRRWANSQPQGAHTGMSLNMIRSVGHMLDYLVSAPLVHPPDCGLPLLCIRNAGSVHAAARSMNLHGRCTHPELNSLPATCCSSS